MSEIIEKIELDEDIYPRKNKSEVTVESYEESLKAGVRFPPITVQEIKEGGEEKTVIIDGWHRLKAYRNLEDEKDGVEPLEVEFLNEETLDKEENLEDLRIKSAQKNLKHGKRLKDSDIERQCKRIVEDRPKEGIRGVKKELADEFSITKGRISQMDSVNKVYNQKVASRDSIIYKLKQVGWTQEEISEIVDIDQGNISRNMQKFSAKLSHILEIGEDEGKSISELSNNHGIDEVILWSKKLENKNDIERGKLFFDKDKYPFKLYNVWRFTGRDSRLGKTHPGNIPGQIAINILYYYTEQEDLVVDPMAGGGSTIDACLILNRKCKAFDLKPVRKDIIENDVRNGIPVEDSKVNLVFLDPPYWRLQKDNYEEESISEGSLNEWFEAMDLAIEESKRILKEGGKVALVTEPFLDEEDTKKFQDLSYLCYEIFESNDFEIEQRISIPLNSQVKSSQDVEYAKDNKLLLDLNRDLTIWRSVE